MENTCKNCNNTFSENFCNRCGQKIVGRLTVPHLAHEAVHVTIHADKGIFPFIKNIVVKPGVLAKAYIDGKRRMFNPLQFLVLTLGVIVTVMALNKFAEGLQAMQASDPNFTPTMQTKLKGINDFLAKRTNIIPIVLLPAFAFFSHLLFRRRGYNYAEHFMLMVFAMCQLNFLNIIVLLTAYFTGAGVAFITASTFALVLICFSITYVQFYRISWYHALFKSLLTYMLTMFVFLTIVIGITVFIILK